MAESNSRRTWIRRPLDRTTSKAQAGAVTQLEVAGIAPYFEVVAGFDAVSRPKPEPDLALYVLD